MIVEPEVKDMLGKAALGDPVIHIVPHSTWPIALCGFRVSAFVAKTQGKDRCPECQQRSVGRKFGKSTPPPGVA